MGDAGRRGLRIRDNGGVVSRGRIEWIFTLGVTIWRRRPRGVRRPAPAQGCSPPQAQLKPSHVAAVPAALVPHGEADAGADKAAPVRGCSRSLSNRPGQFDSQRAWAAALPIGSGEIESVPRSVMQQRLKLAGAWWKEDTAADMLALRTLRANRQWDQYWATIERAAA